MPAEPDMQGRHTCLHLVLGVALGSLPNHQPAFLRLLANSRSVCDFLLLHGQLLRSARLDPIILSSASIIAASAARASSATTAATKRARARRPAPPTASA